MKFLISLEFGNIHNLHFIGSWSGAFSWCYPYKPTQVFCKKRTTLRVDVGTRDMTGKPKPGKRACRSAIGYDYGFHPAQVGAR